MEKSVEGGNMAEGGTGAPWLTGEASRADRECPPRWSPASSLSEESNHLELQGQCDFPPAVPAF